MRQKLTGLTERVWVFIVAFEQDHKVTPTLKEIGRELKISKSLSQYYTNKLVDFGYIKKLAVGRNIKIIEKEIPWENEKPLG